MILPFVARPLYSPWGAHYQAEKAWYTNQSVRDLNMMTGQSVSSLLPDAFNTLMCNALNMDMDGEKATHFVMVHGDIAPQEHWLSMMLDESEATGVDILSAVVPIKVVGCDDTSTAIGTLNGRYSDFRRITTKETLIQLPPTFGPEDCCVGDERLLLNTGLMVVDLRKPWIEDWLAGGGFRLESHAWKCPDGKWKSICIPEDWSFSYDAQVKYGARVAATTKVRLIHYGEAGYANRYPASTEKLELAEV